MLVTGLEAVQESIRKERRLKDLSHEELSTLEAVTKLLYHCNNKSAESRIIIESMLKLLLGRLQDFLPLEE